MIPSTLVEENVNEALNIPSSRWSTHLRLYLEDVLPKLITAATHQRHSPKG